MSKETKNIEKTVAEDIEKVLTERIEKLQSLNTLVRNRAKFNEKKLLLENAINDLTEDIESDKFETDSHAFCFEVGRYNKDAFKISNPMLIKEIAEFVVKKIEEKIIEIEKQLIIAA